MPEVWSWKDERLWLYRLHGDGRYEPIERSELLPDVDLAAFLPLLERPDQTQAVRDYLASLGPGR